MSTIKRTSLQKEINSNGERILNFANLNELHIINRDQDLCTGTFTRVVPMSSTVLDYVLASETLIPDMMSMMIDEGKRRMDEGMRRMME